jgi:hypothetical protein
LKGKREGERERERDTQGVFEMKKRRKKPPKGEIKKRYTLDDLSENVGRSAPFSFVYHTKDSDTLR